MPIPLARPGYRPVSAVGNQPEATTFGHFCRVPNRPRRASAPAESPKHVPTGFTASTVVSRQGDDGEFAGQQHSTVGLESSALAALVTEPIVPKARSQPTRAIKI